MEIIVSNKSEKLFEGLLAEVAKARDPFERILIIVPTKRLKGAIFYKLLQGSQSASFFGIDVELPSQAIQKMCPHIRFANSFDFLLFLSEKNLLQSEMVAISKLFTLWYWEGAQEKKQDPFSTKALALWKEFTEQRKEGLFYDFAKAVPDMAECPYKRVFLFGFSYVAPKPWDFFCKWPDITMQAYLLSPCMLFWNDIGKQRQSKPEHFVGQESASHPILTSYGEKIAAFYRHIEEQEIEVQNRYCINRGFQTAQLYQEWLQQEDYCYEEREKNLLLELQNDLLFFSSSHEAKIEIDPQDISVQIRAAPTLLREVEELYENLTCLSYDRSLEPSSILVLCPDIELYRSYIERVFSQKNSLFSFQIFSPTFSWQKEGFFAALFAFFDLLEKNGGLSCVVPFVKTQSFCAKQAMSAKECEHFVAYMKQKGFQYVLQTQKDGFTGGEGPLRLILDDFIEGWTAGSIDIEETEIVGKCIATLEKIIREGRAFIEKEHSVCEWLTFFENEVQSCFLIGTEESRGFATFIEAASFIRKWSQHNEVLISFSTMKMVLEACLNELGKEGEEFGLKEVIFTEWGPVGLECPVVALLGMNGGENCRSSDLVEALLQARKQLYISYQSFSFEDNGPLLSAPFVETVRHLIEKGFLQSVPIQRVAPLCKAALQERPKSTTVAKLPPFEMPKSYELDLIKKAFKAPLRLFFQERLSLYLPKVKDEENFTAADFYTLQMKGPFIDEEKFHDEVQNNPKLGSGILREALTKELMREREMRVNVAKNWGFSPQEAIKLEFSCHVEKVEEIEKSHFLVPCFFVEGKPLFGTLDNLTRQGHVFFCNFSKDSLLKNWPLICLEAAVAKKFPALIEEGVFFLKDQKKRRFEFGNIDSCLAGLVSHTVGCLSEPCLCYPEIIGDLAEGKRAEIEDPYFQLFQSSFSQKEQDEIYNSSQKMAQKQLLAVGEVYG